MKQELPDRFQLYHYKIDRLLGKGGSGTVYRGLDPESNQVFALKLFHENFFSSRGHIREITKNVNRFKEFSHKNVVKIYDFINGDEGHCLVMEYVDGPDLKWYIENRPWNLKERLVIVAQILNGLQYIHEQDFTHHDLKPANILFTRKGLAKLSDYSLAYARFFGLLGSSLTDQITPLYVAPELIRKEKATPQSDMYSLGMTLYLMFAGKSPFAVDNLQKLYYCHLHVKPEHPHTVNPDCPRELGDIILKMMAKKPEDRFDNCDLLRIRIGDIGKSRI